MKNLKKKIQMTSAVIIVCLLCLTFTAASSPDNYFYASTECAQYPCPDRYVVLYVSGTIGGSFEVCAVFALIEPMSCTAGTYEYYKNNVLQESLPALEDESHWAGPCCYIHNVNSGDVLKCRVISSCGYWESSIEIP